LPVHDCHSDIIAINYTSQALAAIDNPVLSLACAANPATPPRHGPGVPGHYDIKV
jgi:hypothetical protein